MARPPSACPICGRPSPRVDTCHRVRQLPGQTLPARAESSLARCSGCGFWWIELPPDSADLVSAYRHAEIEVWSDVVDWQAIATRRQYEGKVAQLTALVPGGRALDVGCFTGDFLAVLPSSFEPWGIELSAKAAERARSRGIRVVEADAMEADLPAGHFDLIVCSDVIEHVADQHAFAARLASWLAPGGVLAIETGDTEAPMARVMGPRWYYVSIVEHLCAHSATSLRTLMQSVGLEPVIAERRWHQLPLTPMAPARRVGMALGFRAVTAGLGLMRRVVRLPVFAERLWGRYSPWHETRDHLWHVYRRPLAG